SGSGTDTDGSIASYQWREGSTVLSTAQNPTLTLDVGVHTLTLTVTDDDGATDTDTVTITVEAGSGSAATASIDLSTLDGTYGLKLNGATDNDHLGASVSMVGDLDGDGFDDLVLGAPNAEPDGVQDNQNRGVAYILRGDSSTNLASIANGVTGLDAGGGNSHVVVLETTGIGYPSQFSGTYVGGGGDYNDDGFSDLLVGQQSVQTASNAFVVSGGNGTHLADLDGGDMHTLSLADGVVVDGTDTTRMHLNVANAGDVDGDGIDDILFSEYSAGNPIADEAGVTYLVFGSDNTTLDALGRLDSGIGVITFIEPALSELGTSISSAGDINGDGYADIVIGAPRADNLASDDGAAYVVFGSPSLRSLVGTDFQLSDLDGSNGFTLQLNLGFGNWIAGTSVSSAGDFNNDGFDDVLIGAPGTGSAIGFAFIVYGKTNRFTATIDLQALDGTDGVRLAGDLSGGKFGTSVATAGDFNGDGYDDIIIGDTLSSNERVAVFFGADSTVTAGRLSAVSSLGDFLQTGSNWVNLDGIVGITLSNGAFSTGQAVSGGGDINNDGYDDVVIGAPVATSDAGIGYVVFGGDFASGYGAGSTGGTVNTPPTANAGSDQVVTEGQSVTLSGSGSDSDGSVGGYKWKEGSTVHSNSQNPTLTLSEGVHTLKLTVTDNDGATDTDTVVITVEAGSGSVTEVEIDVTTLNGTGGVILLGSVEGLLGAAGGAAGTSVSFADIDGDGRTDALVGEALTDPQGSGSQISNEGQISIVYGTTAPTSLPGVTGNGFAMASLDGSNGISVRGDHSGQKLGSFVFGADIDNNGAAELLGGESNTSTTYGLEINALGGASKSTLQTVTGDGVFDTDEITVTNGFVLDGRGTNGIGAGATGDMLVVSGDLNNDGLMDIIVGDPSGGPSANDGSVHVVFGQTPLSGIDGTVLASNNAVLTFVGSSGSDHEIGGALAVGDIDGDGLEDLIIGSSVSPAAAYVVFGSAIQAALTESGSDINTPSSLENVFTTGFDLLANLNSNAGSDGSKGFLISSLTSLSGSSIAIADLNGDGFDEVVIGSPFSGGSRGAASVILGKANGFANISADSPSSGGFVISTDTTSAFMGGAVASVGNINNDMNGSTGLDLEDIVIGAQGINQAFIIYGDENIDTMSVDTLGTGGIALTGASGSTFGGSVGGGGDFNRDGFDDVIIGATTAETPGGQANGRAGSAYIIFGSATAGSAPVNFEPTANAGNAQTVTDSVTLSGSGTDTDGSIASYQWREASNVLSTSQNPTLTLDVGIHVLVLTVTDNDGATDTDTVVITVEAGGGSGAITSIDLTTLDGSTGFTLLGSVVGAGGSAPGGRAGTAVALGDLDGDGNADAIIGEPTADPNGATALVDMGQVSVLYGVDNPSQLSGVSGNGFDLATLNGTSGFYVFADSTAFRQTLGSFVETGNINAGNREELIIGQNPTSNQSQVVNVITGGAKGSLSLDGDDAIVVTSTNGINGFELNGTANTAGRYLVASGDVNGDGLADTAIGEPDIGTDSQGFASLVLGEATLSNLDGTDVNGDTSVMQFFGRTGLDFGVSDLAGGALALGDIDGDGLDEFVIGAPTDGAAGNVYVIRGTAMQAAMAEKSGNIATPNSLPNVFGAGFDLQTLLDGNGSKGFVIVGSSVERAGSALTIADMNGDGFGDVIVGAPLARPAGFSRTGVVYVVFGTNTGFSDVDLAVAGSEFITIQGPDSNARFGSAIALVGNFNSDTNGSNQLQDIVIGMSERDQAVLVYGDASLGNLDVNMLGSSGVMMTGGTNSKTGSSVSGGGDLNNDGFDDLIIGAPSSDAPGGPVGNLAGAAYVVYGMGN
ncbi:MAG: hypothetical protein ACI9VM_000472, partial [Candidatus Azotimanducaceae bacterium]